MTMENQLEALFNPRSVAVVGASEVPGKASERRTRSLLQGGYAGEVYLINPKRDSLFGLKAYPSLKEIDGTVDLVMMVIPGRLIPQAVEEAAEKGAKGVIVITAGLGETGPEGKMIEARIMDIARAHNIHIIGPNCSGMFSASARMNFLGIPGIEPGGLSILAQSGNIIDSLTHFARRRGRGFSKIISSGNAIGVGFHDYIEYLADDPQTRVIMLYLESIKYGDELVKVCRRTSQKKPIVAIKVGRTKAGQRASASHTGALAADDRIVQAAFEQAGIHRVSNIDEMFDLAESFLDCPPARGRRVAILSEGGGDNSVAADNAERWGLEVPVLSLERQDLLKVHLLAGMPAHNPIDYGGTAEENPAVITACVSEVMADEQVDSVYLTGFFGGFKDIIASRVEPLEIEAARKLVELVRESGKPLAVHTSFANEDYVSIKTLKEGGVPVLAGSDRVAQCLAALAVQADNTRRSVAPLLPQVDRSARKKALDLFDLARKEQRLNLIETEAGSLLEAYGLTLPPALLVGSADEAAARASDIDLPAALKIVSPDIIHKTEFGGVKLNLSNPEEIRSAAEDILTDALKHTSRDRIKGLLLAPMAPHGQECIFGMVRDPQFGPVIMFGLGGIFVEVLKDVSFGVSPLHQDDVERMITSLRGFQILQGVRGQSPRDLAAIRDLILRLSFLAEENPDVAEVDLNPVIVHEKGLSIVDARVILTTEET
jgi:acetate---CoA ligase (ADP-forming)